MTDSPEPPKVWLVILLGGVACLAATGLRLLAWYDGTCGRYGWLMLANVLRLGVVFLSYALLAEPAGLAPREQATRRTRNLFAFACVGLTVLVCAGLPSLWPLVVVVPIAAIGVDLLANRNRPAGGWRAMLCRAGPALALFAVTWYQAASTTDSALLGLGERIDSTVGADRLLEWAKQEIDSTPSGKWRLLASKEAPEDVFELMGAHPGWPYIRVVNDQERYVFVANGSGYGYGITLFPSDEEGTSNRGWLKWRSGVFLGTVSK
jgi:hypothetical protein